MTALTPITKADFLRLTGLKEIHGTACLDRYNNCAHTTLAAVVQSRARLPANAFADKDAIANNCDEINKILLAVYAEIRKRMAEDSKLELLQAWRGLAAPAAGGASSSTPAAPAAAAPAAPAPTSSTGFGFGFGAAAPSTGPVFGFGKAPVAAAATTAAPAGFGFGFGAPAAAPAAQVEEPHAKKEPVFAEPQYYTGAFLDMPNFWEKEVVARSTIFNLDKGFMAANKDLLRERMLKWAKPCMAFYGTDIKYAPIVDRDEETARVILRDADRTFFETEHREKFAEFVHSMFIELGTYGQSMGYIAAICSIALTEKEAAAILRKTAKEVLQGHWAAEAVGFASNAWVFEHILKDLYPDVAEHFDKLKFWPDMYLQKILSALCVHVLPFEQLFDFLDKFFAEGLSFLFRFSLAIVEVFRADLLKTEHFDTLFCIMKLDPSIVTMADVRKIMEAAAKIDIREYALQELKSEKYNDKILPRLAKAPKVLAFEPCTLCEKNKPTKYNDELGIACEECAGKHAELEWDDW